MDKIVKLKDAQEFFLGQELVQYRQENENIRVNFAKLVYNTDDGGKAYAPTVYYLANHNEKLWGMGFTPNSALDDLLLKLYIHDNETFNRCMDYKSCDIIASK